MQGEQALAWWALLCLLATYLAYSQLSIAHQSWGARLGGDEALRSRIVAWREGAALVGVVLASLLPTLLGLPAMLGVFAATLVLGLVGLGLRAPACGAGCRHAWRVSRPARQPVAALGASAFRRLLAVFMLNGIASAIPATLVLFFGKTGYRRHPRRNRCSWAFTSSAPPCRSAVAARRGRWPGPHLAHGHAAGRGRVCPGRRCSGAGDAWRLPWCAPSRAWRWAPTCPCPAPCWRA